MKEVTKYNLLIDDELSIKTQYKFDQEMSDQAWHYHRTESTDYHVLDALFKELELSENDQLVDMGAGTGRVLIYSAYHLGIPVTGIEFMKRSYKIANDNVLSFFEKMKKAYPITLLKKSVENYQISSKDTLFYFFNPFSLIVMRPVIYHLMTSIKQFPRRVQLIFYYPLDDCIHFIDERTPFSRVNQIKLPGYHKDKREVIYIYSND